MVPAWLWIGLITFALAFVCNRLSPRDLRWFNRLRRPPWLTFEWAIPFIWIGIFIAGAVSATVTWQATENPGHRWGLMAGYLLLELTVMAYTPVMCKLRSLRVGTIIGATGFFVGLALAIAVAQVSPTAFALLVPFLLWSPIGTYVTWAMIALNPGEI
ncbi:TspO and MBR related protein [Synechocystis sp. PCC 6714]|nr:TspO and MBR related protein [Synechocystis sp. PCC 6714]